MSDPAKYRTREEVDSYRNEKDPIDNLAKFMIEKSLVTEDELKEIDKEVKEHMKEAGDFAVNSPEPDISEMYTDVLLPSEYENISEPEIGKTRNNFV